MSGYCASKSLTNMVYVSASLAKYAAAVFSNRMLYLLASFRLLWASSRFSIFIIMTAAIYVLYS